MLHVLPNPVLPVSLGSIDVGDTVKYELVATFFLRSQMDMLQPFCSHAAATEGWHWWMGSAVQSLKTVLMHVYTVL